MDTVSEWLLNTRSLMLEFSAVLLRSSQNTIGAILQWQHLSLPCLKGILVEAIIKHYWKYVTGQGDYVRCTRPTNHFHVDSLVLSCLSSLYNESFHSKGLSRCCRQIDTSKVQFTNYTGPLIREMSSNDDVFEWNSFLVSAQLSRLPISSRLIHESFLLFHWYDVAPRLPLVIKLLMRSPRRFICVNDSDFSSRTHQQTVL